MPPEEHFIFYYDQELDGNDEWDKIFNWIVIFQSELSRRDVE